MIKIQRIRITKKECLIIKILPKEVALSMQAGNELKQIIPAYCKKVLFPILCYKVGSFKMRQHLQFVLRCVCHFSYSQCQQQQQQPFICTHTTYKIITINIVK